MCGGSSIGNFINNATDGIIDTNINGTSLLTLGASNVLQSAVTAVGKGIGELNGSTAATKNAQNAANAAVAQQNANIAATQTTNMNNDVTASQTAASLRNGAAVQSRNALGFSTLASAAGNDSVTPTPSSQLLGA